MKEYKVIGVMSGTSLDGVDLAYCVFKKQNDKWDFEIEHALCVPYSDEWKKKLYHAEKLNALEISLLNNELGMEFGKLIQRFITERSLQPDFISSHGHTIYHQPGKKLTLQIGNGAAIAAVTGIKTICDFRSLDVLLGGQGAPLVPMGDQELFSEYDFCLNIGGIANVSFDDHGVRKAYDICPANMVLNHYAAESGKLFDEDGKMARTGEIDHQLLNELNDLHYYKIPFPKSLGKEYVLENIFPLIEKYKIATQNKLATYVEHCAMQIGANCTIHNSNARLLITGGGVYHQFLIERIRFYTSSEVVIPDPKIIEFKEAMIFAFLGVLRIREENNCLSSVTGARKDNCGGAVYFS
jgi:anhydro-N-acetylmuramic acid kinase